MTKQLVSEHLSGINSFNYLKYIFKNKDDIYIEHTTNYHRAVAYISGKSAITNNKPLKYQEKILPVDHKNNYKPYTGKYDSCHIIPKAYIGHPVKSNGTLDEKDLLILWNTQDNQGQILNSIKEFEEKQEKLTKPFYWFVSIDKGKKILNSNTFDITWTIFIIDANNYTVIDNFKSKSIVGYTWK